VQDRVTVCTKHTIGSEIILDTPDGTPSYDVQQKLILVCLEIVLILTQDRCTVCAKCTIASKNVLNASDGTPT
jgi:hypothetical protein